MDRAGCSLLGPLRARSAVDFRTDTDAIASPAGRPAGTATGITSQAAAKPRLPAGSPPRQPQIGPHTPPPDANPRSRLAKHLPKTAGEKNTEKKLPISRAAPPGRATPEMASAAPLARPPLRHAARESRRRGSPPPPASSRRERFSSASLLSLSLSLEKREREREREREGRKQRAGSGEIIII